MSFQVGGIVRTNYNTGPYQVSEIEGPCTCPEYVRNLDGDETPSEPHYHLTCIGMVGHEKGKTYWLNGHRPDGSSVWSNDRLIFDGVAPGVTLDLFSQQEQAA